MRHLVDLDDESITSLEIREGVLYYYRAYADEAHTDGVQWEDITDLHLNNNLLVTLPPLPRGLKTLKCDDNQITSLPPLHEGLLGLSCAANFIEVLPAFPSTLKSAFVGNNFLTSLPEIPVKMTALDASHNALEILPQLSHTSITSLSVNFNPLRSIPDLPDGLAGLMCRDCMLDSLPTPGASLSWVECWNNPFHYGIDVSTIPYGCNVHVEEEVYERFEVRKKMRAVLVDLVAATDRSKHRRLLRTALQGIAATP